MSARWIEEDRVFRWPDGQPVSGLVPARMSAPVRSLVGAAPNMLAALKGAERFITNGVELGFIRMPDPGTPDSAHDTLPTIRAAIAKAEGR